MSRRGIRGNLPASSPRTRIPEWQRAILADQRAPIFTSLRVDWATPRSLYAALDSEFRFTLDPCPLNPLVNGLSRAEVSWAGQRVFCNPPYGPGIPLWLARFNEAAIAVYLLPARTDTVWFHAIVLPHAREIRFLKGRLRFGDGKGRATFPSMVVVFTRTLGVKA